jgi:hypothetical protein
VAEVTVVFPNGAQLAIPEADYPKRKAAWEAKHPGERVTILGENGPAPAPGSPSTTPKGAATPAPKTPRAAPATSPTPAPAAPAAPTMSRRDAAALAAEAKFNATNPDLADETGVVTEDLPPDEARAAASPYQNLGRAEMSAISTASKIPDWYFTGLFNDLGDDVDAIREGRMMKNGVNNLARGGIAALQGVTAPGYALLDLLQHPMQSLHDDPLNFALNVAPFVKPAVGVGDAIAAGVADGTAGRVLSALPKAAGDVMMGPARAINANRGATATGAALSGMVGHTFGGTTGAIAGALAPPIAGGLWRGTADALARIRSAAGPQQAGVDAYLAQRAAVEAAEAAEAARVPPPMNAAGEMMVNEGTQELGPMHLDGVDALPGTATASPVPELTPPPIEPATAAQRQQALDFISQHMGNTFSPQDLGAPRLTTGPMQGPSAPVTASGALPDAALMALARARAGSQAGEALAAAPPLAAPVDLPPLPMPAAVPLPPAPVDLTMPLQVRPGMRGSLGAPPEPRSPAYAQSAGRDAAFLPDDVDPGEIDWEALNAADGPPPPAATSTPATPPRRDWRALLSEAVLRPGDSPKNVPPSFDDPLFPYNRHELRGGGWDPKSKTPVQNGLSAEPPMSSAAADALEQQIALSRGETWAPPPYRKGAMHRAGQRLAGGEQSPWALGEPAPREPGTAPKSYAQTVLDDIVGGRYGPPTQPENVDPSYALPPTAAPPTMTPAPPAAPPRDIVGQLMRDLGGRAAEPVRDASMQQQGLAGLIEQAMRGPVVEPTYKPWMAAEEAPPVVPPTANPRPAGPWWDRVRPGMRKPALPPAEAPALPEPATVSDAPAIEAPSPKRGRAIDVRDAAPPTIGAGDSQAAGPLPKIIVARNRLADANQAVYDARRTGASPELLAEQAAAEAEYEALAATQKAERAAAREAAVPKPKAPRKPR